MVKSIRGVYENGQIKLDELPVGVHRAEVVVTFTEGSKKTRYMKRGMFKKPGGRMSTEEDYREVKKAFEPKERPE